MRLPLGSTVPFRGEVIRSLASVPYVSVSSHHIIGTDKLVIAQP